MKPTLSWTKLISAKLDGFATPKSDKPARGAVIFDTSMGSDNAGDFIIMDACNAVYSDLFPGKNPIRLATHQYTSDLEKHKAQLKFLCGTNIVYTHMRNQTQWALPKRVSNFRNTCLLGVGMSDIGIDDKIDSLSASFYKEILTKRYLHSVRDELTKKKLTEIGIENVLNTACPTMWTLTSDAQSRIPIRKSRNVLTSITDYAFSPELDKKMLEILKQHYEKVFIWIQGSHDIDWCLQKIVDLNQFELVGPGISQLNNILKNEDLDYIGTRLHAGIRSLNQGHRSLIIAVDNRARQIGKDTQLPVVERTNIATGAVQQWIREPRPSAIVLPWSDIDKWKSQFK